MSVWAARADFPALFAEHVIPRLEREIRTQAFLLVIDDDPSWSRAVGEVWQIASRLGASSLPGPILHDLEDWVDRSMLDEVLLAEERAGQISAQLAREEEANPVGYWTRFVAGSQPENRQGMTAVAISLSPPFRQRWNSQQGLGVVERRRLRGLDR